MATESTSEFTDLETASRCPKCGQIGKPQGHRRVDGTARGSKMHKFECRNSRCRWFETDWLVQENPDGTIPIRPSTERKEKEFPVDRALRKQMLDRLAAEHANSIELGNERM